MCNQTTRLNHKNYQNQKMDAISIEIIDIFFQLLTSGMWCEYKNIAYNKLRNFKKKLLIFFIYKSIFWCY